MCSWGQHAVNFLHLVGVLVSAKQLEAMTQDVIYTLEEELKVIDFFL